jgi:hypothetical protein
MSDFYNDSRQEYELDISGSTTEIITINNNDLLTPPATGDANNLIKLVSADNVSQLYILQANASGEIRFLTLDAKNNNNQGGNLLYNTKIGADGKLYFYYSYDILTNIVKPSGWYDVGNSIAQIENTNIAQDITIGTTGAGLTALGAIVSGISATLDELIIDSGAIDVNHEARLQNLEYMSGWDVETIRTNANTRDNRNAISQSLFEIIYANGFTPDIVVAVNRVKFSSQLSSLLYGVVSNALTVVGVAGIGAGIVYVIAQALDDKKKQIYSDELLALNDALQEAPVSTAANYLIHTGLNITSGNTGFTTSGTYKITIQREAVIIIFVDTTLIASVSNVEQFGTSTFTIGETISISKSLLGGGTGGNLVLTVASLATFKEWTEARSSYIITKINGIDTKQRRKGGVIGADDIDTTQFTTTNVSYTDTTDDVFNETITYKQLKSRLNLLPTGTSDVDIYTNTGKIGIGTTPTADRQLHIYNSTYGVARIQSGTSGKSAIEFVNGLPDDDLVDFRLVNDTNLFRLQFQEIVGGVPIEFGDAGSYLMDASKTKTRFYKNFQIDGFVGIGGTPHATLSLDLVGSVRVSQKVGIGTEPAKPLHIYDITDSVARIQSGSSGKSSIEFIRGTTNDNNLDFRFVNESSLFRLQYQETGLVFGADETTYLMDISKTKAQFYDNFQIDGFVGIGTTPSLYKLDVLGGARITTGLTTDGSVGIGTTEPSNKLHIQSDTADTRITIEDVDASAIGLPTNIDFIDGGYTSTLVPTTTNELYAYLANDVITASKQIRFTLKQRMIVDLLLVGGGGAGGNYHGGGGGGGGVFYGKGLVMEAGSYVMIVGRGGVGVSGSTTQRSVNANGEPTMLCYDDGFLTRVKFSLGGVIQQAIGVGGGSGATNNAVPPKLTGWDGGSGGGSTDSTTNGYAVNAGGLPTQGTTFWNGTSYEVGGTAGRSNTAGNAEEWAGGGGGGTASAPAPTTNYTCGKRAVQVPFMPTINFQVSAGGGGGAFATTDLSGTIGLGGDTVLGAIIGGYGAFKVVGGLNTSHPATDGANNTGSGGGGSGVSTYFSKAGNGGTGIAVIRYKLAERLNSCSLDFFRNQSSLIGYSIGNYEGQFKVYKDGIIIPSILINSLGNVAIKSRYNATQIFQVGEKGGRLRIANNDTDFTQIGVNDEMTTAPNIKILGISRTDGKAGNIEYTAGGTSQHIFTGASMVIPPISGFVKSSYVAFHAVASHIEGFTGPSAIITGNATYGWNNILIDNAGWNASTGFFTAPIAGIYKVSVSAWTGGWTGCGYSIRRDATSSTSGVLFGGTASVALNTGLTTQVLINCGVGSTISVWTNNFGVYTIGQYSTISIYLLMPT